jgi:hypothetical protein
MRATFYEALEVQSTADTGTIRAALRAILRRFWSVPRDPSGDTEEAVRFVALGAAILTDDQRREEYDVAARRGANTNPWRVSDDGASMNDSNMLKMEDGSASNLPINHGEPRVLPAVTALTDALPEQTIWTSGFAYGLGALALAMAALFVYFVLGLWLGSVLAMFAMLALLAASVVVALQLKVVTTELSGFTLSRLAITKWRRETSVFVGDPPPQQDTAWIFRLRVMELTRSAAGYSSALHIGIRMIARIVDYALVAILLLLVLWIVGWLIPDLSGLIALLRSPLVLPALVVLFAIPIDSITIAKWRTTPGKFLLGVVVASALTQPDDCPTPDRASLAFSRAIAFAKDVGCFGLWPLALVRWSTHAKKIRLDEGSWEAAGDSVTLVRAAPLFLRAAGVSLALAGAIGVAALWAHDVKTLIPKWFDGASTASKKQSTAPVSVPDAVVAAPTPSTPPPATSVSPPTVAAPATLLATPSSGAETKPPPAVSVPPIVVPPIAAPAASPPPRSDVTIIQKLAPDSGASKATTPPVAKKTDTAPELSEFEKQSAIAKERRTRIDRAEQRVAAARSSGNYGGLQSVCQRWTEDQPGSAEAWRCLGLAKHQNGAGRDALPALRQAIKLDPNDSQVEAAIFKILRP